VQHFTTASRPLQYPVHISDEPFCRQRQQIVLGNRVPVLSPDTWVAPNAVIGGDVDLFDKVSIWYGCVLRGDLNAIRVGAFTNIQDRTVIHAARTSPTGLSAATIIGRYCTIGPGCVLRSATIEDEVILGAKCILMEGSLVEAHSILAPGTVLPPGRLVPAGQLWAGNPAKFVRELTKDEKADIQAVANGMFRALDMHRQEQLPYGTAYREAERLEQKLAQLQTKPAEDAKEVA
jgi:carbonic anhydrase/acetyltransferase-like protein (isoleucine patch superfamily)